MQSQEARNYPDLFDAYFKYVEDTEPPITFHRWALLTSIGALLGRNYYMDHGHWKVYPTLYTMFIGSPGTRKSTAIKMVKKILIGSGYDTIAADKVTKEKFLVDLDGTHAEAGSGEDSSKGFDKTTAENLWGMDGGDDTARECFIMADEFNDFIGINNIDFISLLGSLWDFDGVYQSKTKHGKSVRIPSPTISILGGNTPQNFALAFPPEVLGQGFLSRILLIHGDQSERRITFPTPPDPKETEALTAFFKTLQLKIRGEATILPGALKLLDEIYQNWTDLEDVRFKHYSTRRFTQLLKLCLILSAARVSTTISDLDVIKANTVLAAAEFKMPSALGEFGKGRNSDTAQIILEFLQEADQPMTAKDIWKVVSKDIGKLTDLATLLQGMVEAEKLIHIPQKGFLPKAARVRKQIHVDYTLLTNEERRGLG